MKKIFLCAGRDNHVTDIYAMVDDEDYEYLSQWKWGLMRLYHCETDILYARRYVKINGKTTAILMHREILGLKDRSDKGDHLDRNGLNNQRSNLRISTHAQNMSNRRKKKGASSKYLGVYFIKRNNTWSISCKNGDERYREDGFKTEEEAALKYNEIAFGFKKEFARLNEVL